MNTAARKPRTLTARYASTCEACRKPINAGERIVPCAGVYGAWDHESCGVTESAPRASGWVVEFTDGHEEHVDTRSFKDAARIARTRHDGPIKVTRRFK